MSSCTRPVSRVRISLLLCCCGVVLALLQGCGDGRSSASAAAQAGVLLIGNNSEPQSLDPHKATAVADGKIISALLEGLVRPDPRDSSTLHPGMASSWERNADATEWIFHLRAATWSDGTPVTSADFAYAYRRLLHPRFGGRYAEMLCSLKDARAYHAGEMDWEHVRGVETPDARTLVLRFETPMPNLLSRLLHYTWYPLPQHHVEAHGGMLDRRSEWTKPGNWVGNGAYVLQAWRINDFLSVVPNRQYWRAEAVRNRGIRFLPIVNGYTETRMYFGGKLHISNNVPPEMMDYVQRRAPREFCRDAYYSTIFYRLNTARRPLNDVRVRRALSLAIDRRLLVQRVVRGAGVPAFGFTPPTADYDATYRADADREQGEREQEARDLLAAAGYPDGKGFPSLELMTTSRDVQRVTAESIQAMWQKTLGIHVEIRACEWTAYKTAQQSGEYDISSSTWSGDFADPATFVELWRTGAGNNCTAWGSEECDAELDAAQRCVRQDKRLDHLAAAERIMLRQSPIIPLYWSERAYMKSPLVDGWFPLLLDNHPLDAVGLNEEEGQP